MPKKETANALNILKGEHQNVKNLFEQFEKARDPRNKGRIARGAISALKVHAAVEEELFYPTVRDALEETELVGEAVEEHHVAKVLIAELDEMDDGDEAYEAKFLVLAESIRHHIKEEEGKLFPRIKKTDLDVESLGEKMAQRKAELMTTGVPASREEAMVRAGHEVGAGTSSDKGME